MRKSIIIILILLLTSTNISGQGAGGKIEISTIDSLLLEGFSLRWSDPYNAVLILLNALELSKKINYDVGLAKSHSYLGIAYENLSFFDEAFYHYLEGLKLSDSLNLTEDKGFAYNNIGNYYLKFDQLELGLEYLNKGLEIAQQINNQRLLAYIYRNLAQYHRKKKNFATALDLIQKSLTLREKENDERGIITSLREKFMIYFDMKDYKKTEEILQRLYNFIKDKQNYKLQFARIMKTHAEIELFRNNFKKAEELCIESLALFNELKNIEGIAQIHKILSDIYKAQGKFPKAIENLKQHINFLDSLNKIKSSQRVYLLETQFRNQQLKNQLESKSRELHQQNIITIALFFGFVILGISVYLAQKSIREKRKFIAQISEQKRILEEDNDNKMKLLSIIGHDIKNPLGSVYSVSDYLINNLDSLTKEELINYLNIIYKSNKNLLNLLENLLLWSMNKMGKLNYNFSEFNIKPVIDKNLELYNSSIKEKNIQVIKKYSDYNVFAVENMVSAITRNLINNAIKFAPIGGYLIIETEKLENELLIKIIDNGNGLDKEQIHKILFDNNNSASSSKPGTGLGLQLVKDFVKINKGKLDIKSEKNHQTEFSFTLPVKN